VPRLTGVAALTAPLQAKLNLSRHATTAGDVQCLSAPGRRIRFFLKENPAREILHTRQVELNGFIHSMLTGTVLEEKEYRYFGPRVYSSFVEGVE
jgi:hypothetical protein